MAGLNVNTGANGRKSVDAEIPLVPFIDLLLCCVMFLLVTAVWNQMASLDALQNTPGSQASDRVPSDHIQLQVKLSAEGFLLSTSAGDAVRIERSGSELDVAALCSHLDSYRRAYPQERSITVAADDGIAFEQVVRTMDAAKSRGFATISL